MKWDYFTAHCYYEEKCKQCRDARGKEQSHWVLNIFDNNHHWIENGLKLLGAEGWELVAVQQIHQSYGGTGGYQYLSYWYVFKKPLNN